MADSLIDLTGLVLAGGKSSRMGKDKALIGYNGKAQVLNLANLLEPFCSNVLISRNKDQRVLPENNYETIFDDESSENQGPLTGLISAIEKYPDGNFLAMYCDLFSITGNTIEKLVNGRDKDKYATCFFINNFPEPSIVIIEAKSNPILLEKYRSGRYSIIKFLKEFDCKYIIHDEKIIDKDE